MFYLQAILDNYERDIEDVNARLGPWVGAHDGSSFSPTDSYNRWMFYDSNDISACSKFDKECDNEDSAYSYYKDN